jgi:hypothetical protein
MNEYRLLVTTTTNRMNSGAHADVQVIAFESLGAAEEVYNRLRHRSHSHFDRTIERLYPEPD